MMHPNRAQTLSAAIKFSSLGQIQGQIRPFLSDLSNQDTSPWKTASSHRQFSYPKKWK